MCGYSYLLLFNDNIGFQVKYNPGMNMSRLIY